MQKLFHFRLQFYKQSTRQSPAFSLVEILIAIAIIGFLGVALATMATTANNMMRGFGNRNLIEDAIDEDIANMRVLATNYTYCGSGTTPTPTSGWVLGVSCNGQGPGGEYYYSPSTKIEFNSFDDECRTNNVLKVLVQTMNQQVFPSNPLNLTNSIRQVSIDNNSNSISPTLGESNDLALQSKRIHISYSYSSASGSSSNARSLNIKRDALIYPPISSWCP